MAGMRDKCWTFAKKQAVTASAKSDIINLGAVLRDIGPGKQLWIVAQVDDVAMTDAGSDSTVNATLETDDLEAFGSATARLQIGPNPTFPALSAIGFKRVVAIPPGVFVEQWARIDFAVANGDLTTGKFSVWVTDEIEHFLAAPKTFDTLHS